MSFALKLALVILIIHLKLHGLNAATIIYRYKTVITDNGGSSSNSGSGSGSDNNNDNNLSKNNYMPFNGNINDVYNNNNNNSNELIDETTLSTTTITNTTYDWHISDKLLPHATNSSNNISKNNENNNKNATLSDQQTKQLCDSEYGEYGSSNRCGSGRNILNEDNNVNDSYKHEISNGNQISNIENNKIAEGLSWQFVSNDEQQEQQRTTTNNTLQPLTPRSKDYYQYDVGNEYNNATTTKSYEDQQVTVPSSVTTDQDFNASTSTVFENQTTEIPTTETDFDESPEPTLTHGLFSGWDDIVTAHDIDAFLKQYKTDLNNTCIMDGVKDLIQWWSFTNGSLNLEPFQNKMSYSCMDFSYHNLTDDDKLYKKTLEKQLRVGRNIIVFSASHNNLTKIPFRTLSTINNTLQFLTLKGNSFKSCAQSNQSDAEALQKQNGTVGAVNGSGTYASAEVLAGVPSFTYRDFVKGIETKLHDKEDNAIAWASFPKMPQLLELDISNCNIEHIERDVFRNITGIRKLFLSRNKMITIPKTAFHYLSKLEYLDLSFTNLLECDYKLPHPTLDAIWNLIYGVNIQSGTFRRLKKLKFLDMSHTKLTRNSAMAFTQLGHSLEFMSLCYTSFPLIGNSLFKNTRMIGLDLSGNPYAAFVDDAFESVAETLEYLFFEHSNLKELNWLKNLKNLRVLGLAGNNINLLNGDYFGSLQNLEGLDLSYNTIGNWYRQAFANNTNLRVLNLRNNNINIINYEMLKDFKSLEFLGLGENNFVCDCLLRDLVDVAALNNKKAECESNVFDDISNIIVENADNMAIQGRNATEIKNLLSAMLEKPPAESLKQNYKNLYKSYVRGLPPRLRKVAPKAYAGMRLTFQATDECTALNSAIYSDFWNESTPRFRLIDYEDDHYWCFNGTQRMQFVQLSCQAASFDGMLEDSIHELTIIVVAAVCTFMGVTLVAVLLYLKRWHIYYYYSSLKSAALLSMATKDQVKKFNELAESDPQMVYDIFISYCQSDRDWVLEELLPNVEEAGNISICLHERDFQIGVAILENIISCMDRSRALMLIVSSNFLLSHWCQFEMHLAQHRIFEVSKEHLIIVFLEDIPRSKRPKTLQYLMEVKTYIKWPGAKGREVKPEERKHFWKRFRRSLEHIGIAPTESHA
ncbi:toll-like receptor 3 isoform X2 [Zeugodacus cucurbitae]|uniref:toll-like receptor 3 isoform X2 n=1 Tax=Zeugodacus cucurbitae TaxID=28588 RepID=UPI0023D94827|nr:toll-like receptor 3 isoform X2 [Zeugodacus cucurbitae]